LIAVPATNVHPIPEGLSFEEAAAFPLVFETAYRMLVTRAGLREGEWVLAWGIGGGVSTAALAIAKALGARVLVTSSSDAKLGRLRARDERPRPAGQRRGATARGDPRGARTARGRRAARQDRPDDLMALRNRVTPLGELVATPERGLVYGNRGCLHDEQRRI